MFSGLFSAEFINNSSSWDKESRKREDGSWDVRILISIGFGDFIPLFSLYLPASVREDTSTSQERFNIRIPNIFVLDIRLMKRIFWSLILFETRPTAVLKYNYQFICRLNSVPWRKSFLSYLFILLSGTFAFRNIQMLFC